MTKNIAIASALALMCACSKTNEKPAEDRPAETETKDDDAPGEEPITDEKAAADERPAPDGTAAADETASGDEAAPVGSPAAEPFEPYAMQESEVPENLKYKGKLVDAIAWTDLNGENIVLFSETHRDHDKEGEAAAYNYVHHYATKDGKTRELRVVRDKVEECPVDVTLSFERKALSATDLDKDGYGESTFAYWISCKGDVSPDGLKLLVLENGDKYIIRGSGHFANCDPTSGADEACKDQKTVDESFKQGPKVFLNHALRVWAEISPQEI